MIEVSPDTLDAWLNGLAWTLGLCTLLWLVGSLVGAVHRRTYNFTVAAANPCGTSPVTPLQSVTIP